MVSLIVTIPRMNMSAVSLRLIILYYTLPANETEASMQRVLTKVVGYMSPWENLKASLNHLYMRVDNIVNQEIYRKLYE